MPRSLQTASAPRLRRFQRATAPFGVRRAKADLAWLDELPAALQRQQPVAQRVPAVVDQANRGRRPRVAAGAVRGTGTCVARALQTPRQQFARLVLSAIEPPIAHATEELMTVAVMRQHRGRSFWFALGGTLSFRGGLQRGCSNYRSTGRCSKWRGTIRNNGPAPAGLGPLQRRPNANRHGGLEFAARTRPDRADAMTIPCQQYRTCSWRASK